MQTALQTTYTDVANTLITGLTGKPVKARKNATQSSVMAEAHRLYALHREGKAKTFIRAGKMVRELPKYDRGMFAWFLGTAWNKRNFAKSKQAWDNGTLPTVTIDAATFQSCRTDAMMEW